jgi:enamine deaminase RidA (YjgF/YER057c/UK114 family)
VKKTILTPGPGQIDSEKIDEPPSALAVAIHHSDHVQLEISGTGWSSGDLEAQTRNIFELFERFVSEFDGDMRSIVRNRIHIREPYLTATNRRLIHEIRSDFFTRPHYPASTFVEVSDLAHDDTLVEIEADAVIPKDGWETEVRMDD